jgi:type IV fimbrial biogenesis protein FimT
MKQKGYTLIELLATLSVIAILTGVAWPSYLHLSNSIKQDMETARWVKFFESARSLSTTQELDVTICALVNDQCSNDFNNSWSVFIDQNGNKTVDVEDEIVRVLEIGNSAKVRLYKSGRNYLRFYSKPNQLYSGPTASISVCPNGYPDQYSFHLKMNIMGRVKIEDKKTEEGIPMRKTSSGWKSITC